MYDTYKYKYMHGYHIEAEYELITIIDMLSWVKSSRLSRLLE